MRINSPYGTGKTFFIKRWISQLRTDGWATAYFNAWETDFANDPLAAFMSAIETQVVQRKEFATARKNFGKLARSAAPLVAKGLIKRAVGDEAGEALTQLTGLSEDELAKKLETAMEERLKAQKKAEASVVAFRAHLTQLASSLKDDWQGPKLVIFVDELDRCNPRYALSMLETIKHFFSVVGVAFIVGVDKVSLSHTLTAPYGSGFDGDGYVRRFFDLWLNLPPPNYEQFARVLISKFALVEDNVLERGDDTKKGADMLVTSFAIMSQACGLSLRQQEQVFAEMNLALRSKAPKQSPYAAILPVIAIARHVVPDLCRNFCLGLAAPNKFVLWVYGITDEHRKKFKRLPQFVLAWGMTEDTNLDTLRELPQDLVKDGQAIFQELYRQRGHTRENTAADIYHNLEFWGGHQTSSSAAWFAGEHVDPEAAHDVPPCRDREYAARWVLGISPRMTLWRAVAFLLRS